MSSPLYEFAGASVSASVSPSNAHRECHKGLWFERFFNRYDQSWDIPALEKQNWINTVTGKCGKESALSSSTDRQKKLCFGLSGKAKAFSVEWHFTTGLGNAHPVENGFAWHQTLGTPYLSGASVKGLVRSYIETWAGLDKEEVREICRFWFGSEFKNPNENNDENPSAAGAFIFFDAIPIRPVTLACDIMTPHMKNWYAKGSEIPKTTDNADSLPADWHNPVPIPFLVVKEGDFLFTIAPRHPQNQTAQDHLELVFEALSNALEYIGAGAKTGIGYGRLSSHEALNKTIEKEHSEIERSGMPVEERFRAEFQDMNDKEIAEMFGKGFNKTKASKGSDWDLYLSALFEAKGDLVSSWGQADKNTAENKAYKKLNKYRGN